MNWDEAYANAPYIPGGAEYPARWKAESQSFRQTMSVLGRARLGVMYGHGTREVVDVFQPDGAVKGLFVFVHGGYWLKFDGTYWSHLAQGALDQGWVVAIPTYDLCPRVRIADITRQIAQAITVVAHEFSGSIRLAGHSAGGHLAARMLDPDVLPGDVLGRVTNCVPISMISDLRPLLNTSMNAEFKMDEDSAAAESPVLMPKPDIAVTARVGADERPVFLDQTRWLAEAWGCQHVVEPKKHHFDVIDGLQDAKSPLMSAIFQGSS